MNVNVEEEDEVNFVKHARARSNACFKCGEMGHFQHDCQYNGDKPSDNQAQGQTALDSYDQAVGKWMTNLVATTPITAKAMCKLKKLAFTLLCWYYSIIFKYAIINGYLD